MVLLLPPPQKYSWLKKEVFGNIPQGGLCQVYEN
jgi:hypothetical protein